MGGKQNPSKTLHEKYFGADWIASIPAKWKAGLRYFVDKTSGIGNLSDPDPITGDVVSSELATNRTNELERKTTRLNADLLTGAVTHGQNLDRKTGIITPFTEHLSEDNTEVGEANKEINPLNPTLSEVKEYDFSAIAAFADTFLLELPGKVNLYLPDELVSLTAVMERNIGEGTYDETGSGFAFAPGGWHLSIPGRGEGGITLIPELIPVFKSRNGRDVTTARYIFLLPLPITTTDIINTLTSFGISVLAWPKFSPQRHTIELVGQELALQVNTSAQEEDSLSSDGGEGYSESSGAGYSKKVGLIIRTKEFPETIHGIVNISGVTSDIDSVGADASSTTGGISASESQTGAVEAFVTPTSLASTGNTTSVPTSGKYMLPADAEPFLPSWALVHAEVVDFANVG